MPDLQEPDTVYTPDNLLAGDFPIRTETVIIKAGQIVPRGAVLGEITVEEKYVLSLVASNDGSEEPDVVLVEDCDATSGDKEAAVYISGDFSANHLQYGVGHDAATVRKAFRHKRPLFVTDTIAA